MPKVKLSVYVPTELHRQAKYASIERGTTIQHIVEDALQQNLDPTQSTAPSLKPQEVNMAHKQLDEILLSGNEPFITSCLASIRGTHGLLKAAGKVMPIGISPELNGIQTETPMEKPGKVAQPQVARKKRVA